MNKKDFLKLFSHEEENLVSSLYDKYILAYNKDITTFGNCFYPPNIWSEFIKAFNSSNFSVSSDGLFDMPERRMISFNNTQNLSYPYEVIVIENKSKFQKLSHRDYLGALLSLGIKREKMGDLLISDNKCYVPVCDEIAEFILMNLGMIGRSKCSVSVAPNDFVMPKVEFKEEVVLVQSLRLDAIISKITNLSRAKSVALIEESKVLVSYVKAKDKSLEVCSDTCITIRGYGKYIIGEVIGSSKSGKIRIIIKKYT